MRTGKLNPIAGAKNDKNKNCDDRNDDKHPVLAIEAKQGKVLDQKMQRPRSPFCGQNKCFPWAR
jgi:hypothetical protein